MNISAELSPGPQGENYPRSCLQPISPSLRDRAYWLDFNLMDYSPLSILNTRAYTKRHGNFGLLKLTKTGTVSFKFNLTFEPNMAPKESHFESEHINNTLPNTYIIVIRLFW